MYFDFNYILNQLGSVGIADVFDIIIVAFVFYYLFKFVRERRAGKLAIGVLFLIVMLFISELANMRATYFILKNVVNVGLIALLIVFQPELRSMLEKMGSEPLKGFRGKLNNSAVSEYRAAIGELTAAVDRLSESKTGALIVIEGSTKLGDVIKTGTVWAIYSSIKRRSTTEPSSYAVCAYSLRAASCRFPPIPISSRIWARGTEPE